MGKLCFTLILAATLTWVQTDVPDFFPVSYVAAGAIYLKGGREAGLAEGFHLTIRRVAPGTPVLEAPVIAEVTIVSVAATSAVCEIQSQTEDIKVGDSAFLSAVDSEVLKMLYRSRNARRYAQVISFSQGDPIEEEAREYVPRPPSPEVNRIRARVSLEQSAISDHLSNSGSQQMGVSIRADMTRINGSFWNLTGYWRGRRNARHASTDQQTLADLINRTYHLGVFYDNPKSKNLLGFGRLLLPWASSLDTIDGGYYARRLSKHNTAGVFAGSAPDPTSWNFAPDRRLTGAFFNTEAGDFDRVKVSSTTGVAISRRGWTAEREFLFLENSLMAGTKFSIFHGLQADKHTPGRFGDTQSGVGVTRSFLTVRFQPTRIFSFDINHNRFTGVPTFDSRLLGTGLLDKFLFQGLSGGIRLDLPHHVTLYSSLGRNKREEEARPSWNYMFGATFTNFLDTKSRIDFRRSTFDSAFGRGEYYNGSFSKELVDRLRLEVQLGKQNFSSPLTGTRRALYLSTNLEWFLGNHYFVGAGHVHYTGAGQKYEQYFSNIGYRF